MIDPAQGGSATVEAGWPLAFVDLDRCDESLFHESLPPVAVIGIGERGGPCAERVDAIRWGLIDAIE